MQIVSCSRTLVLLLLTAGASAGVAVAQTSRAPGSLVTEAPNGPWSLRSRERVRGTTFEGRVVEGRLVSQTDSALIVERGGGFMVRGTPVSLRYDELARIEAHRPPAWRGRAMLIGTTVGLGVGAVLGAQSVNNECSGSGNSYGPCFSRGSAGFVGALFGMGLGGATARLASWPRWQLLSVQRRVTADPGVVAPRARLTTSTNR